MGLVLRAKPYGLLLNDFVELHHQVRAHWDCDDSLSKHRKKKSNKYTVQITKTQSLLADMSDCWFFTKYIFALMLVFSPSRWDLTPNHRFTPAF